MSPFPDGSSTSWPFPLALIPSSLEICPGFFSVRNSQSPLRSLISYCLPGSAFWQSSAVSWLLHRSGWDPGTWKLPSLKPLERLQSGHWIWLAQYPLPSWWHSVSYGTTLFICGSSCNCQFSSGKLQWTQAQSQTKSESLRSDGEGRFPATCSSPLRRFLSCLFCGLLSFFPWSLACFILFQPVHLLALLLTENWLIFTLTGKLREAFPSLWVTAGLSSHVSALLISAVALSWLSLLCLVSLSPKFSDFFFLILIWVFWVIPQTLQQEVKAPVPFLDNVSKGIKQNAQDNGEMQV